jgi:RNA polymerase sigma-70 factor, ECF subfamily
MEAMSRWTATHDAVLVLRCQEGDARAFSELVDRWQPRLVRHAARLVGDAEAAADIAQETWVAAVEKLRRLDDPDAFGPWLFRILTRKAADWIRRRQRGRRLWDRLLRRAEEASRVEADEGLGCRQEGGQDVPGGTLQGAISALPREQAEAVALHYLEEFSVPEVAEITGVPAGTVKSRLHYARLRLRELLKEPDDVGRK